MEAVPAVRIINIETSYGIISAERRIERLSIDVYKYFSIAKCREFR